MRTVSRLARFALRLPAACVLAASVVCGADEVPKNYLSFKVGYAGTAHSTKNQNQDFKSETKLVFADQFSGLIEVRPERSAGGVTWSPRGDTLAIKGSISETSTTTNALTGEGEVHATETRVTTYTGDPECEANLVNAFVTIRPGEKLYDIQFTLMPDMATTMEAVLEANERDIVGAPSLGGGQPQKREPAYAVPLDTGPAQMNLGFSNYSLVVDVKDEPLSRKAGVLTGTKRIPVPRPADWNGSWDIAMEVTWKIDVSPPPLELVITVPGYAQWRPEGSIAKPAEPGNSLVARATLKTKAGNVNLLPEVKSIRFQLLDTSREPGVCLNWPLEAKDEDYDLRLAVVAGGTLSKSDQKLEVTDPKKNEEGQPYAEVKIDSYDFGGRASFRAVCTLADGREIEGVMKGEGEMPRMPRMQGPGWIAESWRTEKKAGKLADDDDNEKVDGQKDNGDGFTLYEEYRGWVEKGKHIEGDPLKKDFFIRNKIGADAKGGIALFERVSKLRTHGELRDSEMIDLPMHYTEAEANAKGERIMNLNHRDGPHRVDQHCVVMINTSGFRSSGGATSSVINGDTTNRALRPGKAYLIRVEERGRSDGVFSKHESTAQYNLSEREAAVAYDRAVAHELLHSVGVDHHGEGEDANMFFFQGAGDPMNTAHRPRFVKRMPPSMSEYGESIFGRPAVWSDFDRGPTVTLLWEDTGEDVAQSLSADFERELTAERQDPLNERAGSEMAAKFPQYGKAALFWSEMSLYNSVSGGTTKRGILHSEDHTFDRYVTIGRYHEADSGNELCLMRYYFANAYPVDATEKAFYLVRPGGNRVGQELCKSPEGTGQNASDHKPKSRFGDSAPDRGGCFQYVCPNDAIPPRTL